MLTNNPKLAIETIKACLIVGQHSDVATRLWEMIEDQELPRNAFGKAHALSNQELLPIKEFFLSSLSNKSYQEVTSKSINDFLRELYNVMISNAMSGTTNADGAVENDQQSPQDILNEALSKWMALDK